MQAIARSNARVECGGDGSNERLTGRQPDDGDLSIVVLRLVEDEEPMHRYRRGMSLVLLERKNDLFILRRFVEPFLGLKDTRDLRKQLDPRWTRQPAEDAADFTDDQQIVGQNAVSLMQKRRGER